MWSDGLRAQDACLVVFTPALHHALAGRRFLPSLTPLVMTGVDAHAVQFCGNDGSGLDGVAAVLSSALHRGDTVATVLIESNRDALTDQMKERGWNLGDLGKQGRYLVFDAEAAATRVMRAGRPHLESIAEMVAALENARTGSAAGPRSHLTIVGEMPAVLCRRGKPEAALELERLWDQLTRSLPSSPFAPIRRAASSTTERRDSCQVSQLITRLSDTQSGLDDRGHSRRRGGGRIHDIPAGLNCAMGRTCRVDHNAAPELFVGELGEPALDEIYPRPVAAHDRCRGPARPSSDDWRDLVHSETGSARYLTRSLAVSA